MFVPGCDMYVNMYVNMCVKKSVQLITATTDLFHLVNSVASVVNDCVCDQSLAVCSQSVRSVSVGASDVGAPPWGNGKSGSTDVLVLLPLRLPHAFCFNILYAHLN